MNRVRAVVGIGVLRGDLSLAICKLCRNGTRTAITPIDDCGMRANAARVIERRCVGNGRSFSSGDRCRGQIDRSDMIDNELADKVLSAIDRISRQVLDGGCSSVAIDTDFVRTVR